MRRFAKALVKTRDKKTSNSSSASATTTTTTSIITTTTTTIGTASDSSATSTSSIKYDQSTKKPSWKSWLGRSRKPAPVWTPSFPVPEPLTVAIDDDDDDDDDSSQLSTPFSSILDPDLAKGNFRRIVTVALDHSHTSPSPFVQPSRGPLFPRSINSPNLLSPSKSLLSGIQRRQLLSRLESQVDVSPILPFAVKQPPPIPASHPSPNDISLPPSDIKLSSASLGIQRWINRPCFEDRYLVYLPFEDGQVNTHPVTASSLAIAALEYSEHLDVMADPDFDQPPSKHGNDCSPPPPSTSHASISESSSLTASTRSNTSYTTAPSPLRNQHSPPPQPPTVHQPTSDQSKSQPAIKSTVKRVVRFAEDDSDGEDGLPLHIVRMKKKREQKAQFLRQEQLRRAKQQEEERRRREQEAVERERIRLEGERERKEREKERIEREKVLYAETVAAARMRREMQRAGASFTLNATNSSSLLVPSTSFTSLKDSERNKPPPDSKRFSSRSSFRDPSPSLSIPRREPSDSALHLSTPPLWSNYLTDSSPSSSRPPSLSHSPVSPTYGPHSRPPSTYSAHSSSSEDARRGGSRRNSAANSMPTALGSAGGNSSLHLPPMMGYPTWIPGGYIQPVPSFLEYPHDMPLLPPTAPFMKHDKRSRNSSPGGNSTSSGSRRGSFNSSTERLDRPLNVRAASNPVPRRDGSTSGHSRQPSGDSSRSQSTQARPPNPTHKSQPVISRGRSSLPPSHSQNQYLQTPSPWSALPSQFGTLPTSMPWSSSQMRQNQSQSTGGKQRRQQTYPLVS